jgi:hypothetical protein
MLFPRLEFAVSYAAEGIEATARRTAAWRAAPAATSLEHSLDILHIAQRARRVVGWHVPSPHPGNRANERKGGMTSIGYCRRNRPGPSKAREGHHLAGNPCLASSTLLMRFSRSDPPPSPISGGGRRCL